MPESTPTPSSVRDLKAADGSSGRPFASVLVIRKLTVKTASNGNPYMSAELGDRTGSFSCTVFSDNPAYEVVRSAAEGAVIRVEGRIESYQGRFSPKLTRASVVPPEELSSAEVVANLVETAPEDAEVLSRELDGFVESIARAELRATARHVLDEIGETFRTAPAATMIHHAYRRCV